jgi:enamine deaminase RidA (YjgF/YER057c/UK114 family)
MDIEKRLAEMGLTLPPPAPVLGAYVPVKPFGNNLLYVSGNGPFIGESRITGRVPDTCSFEDACRAAECCVLNILSQIKLFLNDLSRVTNCVKMTVYVTSAADFNRQPQVANAATELLMALFGREIGCPARAAVGVSSLPADFAVEIDLLIEYK